jgi:hypothetical protein
MTNDLEAWRRVWRDGLAPLLSARQLAALRDALAGDDVRLLQGATTDPPPLAGLGDWPVRAACLVAYGGVAGMGGFPGGKPDDTAVTVAEVQAFFARTCGEIDRRMGEPGACRFFLNWFDETPRNEMRRALLPEVERSLALLGDAPCTPSPSA